MEEKPNQKEKEENLEVEGLVIEAVKGAFRVDVTVKDEKGITQKTGNIVLAKLAGKLRKNFIKIVPGDTVRVELSPYDLTRGRITYRMK